MVGQQNHGGDFWYDTVFDQAIPGYHPTVEAAAAADYQRLLVWVKAPIRLGRQAMRVVRQCSAARHAAIQSTRDHKEIVAVSVPD